MLRNRKLRFGWHLLFILMLQSAINSWVATASDDVPVGFKAERYQPVWERNPFTIVTPVVQQAPPKLFDKFVLLSWLNDGGNDVVFVQNIETNEVQKVTKDPNSNSLRLLAIHKAADPKDATALLSNGTEEGNVKFRLETAAPAPQHESGKQQSMPTAGVQSPGLQVPPTAISRQTQPPRNGTTQPEPVGLTPRASEVRRKRITAPPAVEQPISAPTPAQNSTGQPQTQ
jgi:hypothetical protein